MYRGIPTAAASFFIVGCDVARRRFDARTAPATTAPYPGPRRRRPAGDDRNEDRTVRIAEQRRPHDERDVKWTVCYLRCNQCERKPPTRRPGRYRITPSETGQRWLWIEVDSQQRVQRYYHHHHHHYHHHYYYHHPLICRKTIYTVSQKTRQPIVTIISLNLDRFSKFFYYWKACKM